MDEVMALGGDYLAHSGVLGMHWGIRKPELDSREGPSTTSPVNHDKLKKGLIIGGAVIGTAALVVGGVYLKKRFGFNGVKIPSGTKFQNINEFGDDLNLGKHTYLTFKPHDNEHYQKVFGGAMFKRLGPDGVIFKTSLKSKVTIKTPTEDQAQKLYTEWRSKFPKQAEEFGSSEVGHWMKLSSVRGGKIHTPGDNTFGDFLTKKGYNGLIDIFDKTMSNLKGAETPIMVLNGKELLTNIGSEFLKNIF